MEVKSSVFLQLIHGQLLPMATILVTSRSWATTTLLNMCHHRIFKHIEILGFTCHHIEEYVRSAFTDNEKSKNDKRKERDTEKETKTEKDIEDVITYIATYPQIKACMYIPLNSAIVVSVYKESRAGRCILPKTLTELYYSLTQMLLLRYLRGHPVHSKKVWNIQHFERDLPQEVYKQLLNISQKAYAGICTDWGNSVQLVYSDLPPTFETLGLMQAVSQMYVTRGVSVSHNFLHLTVQEFLAALHISNMSPEKQQEHLKRDKGGRFKVVLRFLAGLNALKNDIATMDEKKQKELLDKALEEGHIRTGLDVLLFIGAAGSSKSHYKHLCLGLPPPKVRDSTGLSEPPIRTMSFVRGAVEMIQPNSEATQCTHVQWSEVHDKEFIALILQEVAEGKFDKVADPSVMTALENKIARELPILNHNPENIEHVSNTQKENVVHSEPEGSEPHQGTSENVLSNQSENLPSKSNDVSYNSNFFQELLKVLKSSTTSQEKKGKLMDAEWIYIVDSGGQPQFREMLPVLVQMATACVLTLKLNVPLGELNEVKFYHGGKQVCKPYLSVLTNEQIVKHCSQIVDSQTKDCKLFVIGTHQDLEHECETESKADKNEKLLELLQPQLGTNLEVYKTGDPVELIFPVNSKTPKERDYEVVEQFRMAVYNIARHRKKVNIPLYWFLLELLIHNLATQEGGILSFQGCKEEAIRELRMSEESFLAAVIFLAKRLGTILYFPQMLQNIIFKPQALMNILSELVKLRHLLNNNESLPAECQGCNAEWLKFKRSGIMTKNLLKVEPLRSFFSKLFTPDDFLCLMTKLLIVAKIPNDAFFYPSVLEELPPARVEEKIVKSRNCLAPLVIFCTNSEEGGCTKENWLPVGSFTSLVAQLLNVNKWTLCMNTRQNPSCLYRNCIQFRLPCNEQGIVTLVDQYKHMEIYLQVNRATVKTLSEYVGPIILNGIREVHKSLPYSKNGIQLAFLCPRHKESHIATLDRSDLGQWNWTCEVDCCISEELTETQLPWQGVLEDSATPYSPVVSQSTTEHTLDCAPTMTKLLQFRTKTRCVNIFREIGTNYKNFGTLLLEDESGANIEAIVKKHRDDSESINREILREWLQGRGTTPVSWRTLVDVLNNVGLKTLAKDIAKTLQGF